MNFTTRYQSIIMRSLDYYIESLYDEIEILHEQDPKPYTIIASTRATLERTKCLRDVLKEMMGWSP